MAIQLFGLVIQEKIILCMETSCKGTENPFFGKHYTEKYKQNASKKWSEYYKEHDNHSKNFIWINNGIINKRISSNSKIPDGFVPGIYKYHSKTKS